MNFVSQLGLCVKTSNENMMKCQDHGTATQLEPLRQESDYDEDSCGSAQGSERQLVLVVVVCCRWLFVEVCCLMVVGQAVHQPRLKFADKL